MHLEPFINISSLPPVRRKSCLAVNRLLALSPIGRELGDSEILKPGLELNFQDQRLKDVNVVINSIKDSHDYRK